MAYRKGSVEAASIVGISSLFFRRAFYKGTIDRDINIEGTKYSLPAYRLESLGLS